MTPRTTQLHPVRRLLAAALVLVVVLTVAACGAPLPGPSAPAAVDVAGSWSGRLDGPDGPLDVGLTLTGPLGSLSGTLDIPAQNVRATPLADVSADGGTVLFTVPGLTGDASFAGTLAADGSAIGGTFTQQGAEFPLVLLRAS
jgi:uncharacterized protein